MGKRSYGYGWEGENLMDLDGDGEILKILNISLISLHKRKLLLRLLLSNITKSILLKFSVDKDYRTSLLGLNP